MSATAVFQPFFWRLAMPKYLVEAAYTAEGAKGLIKAGGSPRRAAVQKMVESLGGRLGASFFTFGPNDVPASLDLRENLTAPALSLALPSTGACATKRERLL